MNTNVFIGNMQLSGATMSNKPDGSRPVVRPHIDMTKRRLNVVPLVALFAIVVVALLVYIAFFK